MTIEPERFTTVPLFEGLEPSEIASLLRIAEDVVANPGEVIVREGDAGDGFYVIGKGAFDVVKGGQSKALAQLAELSFFGEMSLVSKDPRSASVICVEEGRLKKFPSSSFEGLIRSNDPVASKVIFNMCRRIARRLSALEERFIKVSDKSQAGD